MTKRSSEQEKPNKDFLKKYYEREAAELGCQTRLYFEKQLFSEHLFHNLRRLKVEAMIKKFIGNSGYFLEVGCAEGYYTRYAASMSLSSQGVDIARNYLLKAKLISRHFPELLKRTEYVEADAEKLPFRDKSIRFVLCSEVLEHLSQPFSAINEIKRVLQDGGILILSVPTIKSSLFHSFPGLRSVLKLHSSSSFSREGHIHKFSSYELMNKLQDKNFRALETLGVHNYLTAIAVHSRRLKQRKFLRRIIDLTIYCINLFVAKLCSHVSMRGIVTIYVCTAKGSQFHK